MTADPIKIFGDYAEFFGRQVQRLLEYGVDVSGMEVSHLAFRTETIVEYLSVRQQLELICSANVENVWNGRPISKLLLRKPLRLSQGAEVSLIELIPPTHQNHYCMGLEHVGFVVGEAFEEFAELHAEVFSGQQDQGQYCQPYFVAFPDNTNVKFYRHSLQKVCLLEGKKFDDFYHELEK